MSEESSPDKKLNVTVDESQTAPTLPRGASQSFTEPPETCSSGHAFYAYIGTRKLVRVGSSTCLEPAPGHSAASAPLSVMIPSALSDQLGLLLDSHPDFNQIRLSTCCPLASEILSQELS